MTRAIAILALLLAAFALKGLLLVPPAPSANSEFNTARAAERLARILGDQRPHPVDTPANDAVRERLMAELRALGLEPMVRTRPDCRGMPASRVVSCSLTRNVVAVIGAGRPGKALLLNAHYDSTPAGPGAADDGIGVATMLEVGAILSRCQAPFVPTEVEGRVSTSLDTNGNGCPTHPVILLFNEGEEFGLNGAGAFVDGDPLAARVGSLINLEARGVDGPAWMFETSEPNGPAIAAFAAASRRPYANSLTADFAKLIPNYTDVVVFKDRGWTTLSYAIVGNETRYHSPGDRIEALSRASLQHMGSEVLAATRSIGDANGGGRTLYADIAGRFLIKVPFALGAVALGLLVVGLGFTTLRRRAWSRPLAACAAAAVGGIAAAAALASVAGAIRPGDYWRAYPLVAYLAVYATILAAMVAVIGAIGARVERERLRVAAWLLVVLAGAALALAVPGAIIFFLLAPAIALAGLWLVRAQPVLLWTAALVQLLMFAALLASIEMLLIDGPLWAVAPLAALAALPFLVEARGANWRAPASGLAALAGLLWLGAMLMPRASAERPLAFTLDYVRDDVAGKSQWAVASKQAPLPAGWDRFGSWKRGVLPYSGRTRWLAAAPMIEVPAATVTRIGEVVRGGRRLVRLRFASGGADALALRFDKDVPVLAMGLPGRRWRLEPATRGEPTLLRCTGRACDGLEAEVELGTVERVAAKLIATRFALPPQAAPLIAARPTNAHNQYGANSSIRISPASL